MKTFKLLIAALALIALAQFASGDTNAPVTGVFSPGLEPTVGWHQQFGYAVVRDPNTGNYFPIGMPDLGSIAPTNDTPGGLTDYFIGNTANIATNYNAWNTNAYWDANLTIEQTNGVLRIKSAGVDEANMNYAFKVIPYPTNNWKATLIVLDTGIPGVDCTNAVSCIGLAAQNYTNGPTVGIDIKHVDGSKFDVGAIGAVSNALLNNMQVPWLWLYGSAACVTHTNAGLTSGLNLTPISRGPIALQLSYVQSTKVMTFKAASLFPGVPIELQTIGTYTWAGDPTNILFSVYDYDATGAVAPTHTRVIKAFQFEQNSK